MTDKAWDGRFSQHTDIGVERFTASIAVDQRLYPYDLAGSSAHCRMLAKQGIITPEEAGLLEQGLEEIRHEFEAKSFQFDDRLEDIHMHIEARLLEKVGTVAHKLHTARSRNDQVALDIRMYLREAVIGLISGLTTLRMNLVALAEAHVKTVMPGYTHLQRAQPVLFGHHLMAYYEMFSRDVERLQQCLVRINVMPLGSAALAGTTYPIDRDFVARLLDFPVVSANSIDAVSDRDFIIEFLSAASLCMVHFSRFSEELVLWSSAEFAFIELPDAYATGSSIMPQKKNPDVPELVRGKAGRVFGALIALLTIMKSLPLAYNRDLQEDKQPLFDAVDTLSSCVGIYNRLLPHLNIIKETMYRATQQGYLNATDLADYLTGKGMPFREAHGCAGKAVAFALARGKELQELTLKELKSFSALIDEDIFDALTVERMIDRRISAGGTATANVMAAIQTAKEHLQDMAGTDQGKNDAKTLP